MSLNADSKPTPPRVPLSRANAEKNRAQWQRGQAIMRVRNQQTSMWEIIQLAGQYKHLRKIRLQVLIQATHGMPRIVKTQWGEKLARLLDTELPEVVTVGWVIDKRSQGKRLAALRETLDLETSAPWPGWPYTPNPAHEHTV